MNVSKQVRNQSLLGVSQHPASFSYPPDWLWWQAVAVILPLAVLSLAQHIAVLYIYSKDVRLCEHHAFYVLNLSSCDFILCGFSMPVYIYLIVSSGEEYIGLTACTFVIILNYISTDVFPIVLLFYVIESYRRIYMKDVSYHLVMFTSPYAKKGIYGSWGIAVVLNVLFANWQAQYENYCYQGVPYSIHGHTVYIITALSFAVIIFVIFSAPILRTQYCSGYVCRHICCCQCWRAVSADSSSSLIKDAKFMRHMENFITHVKHPPIMSNSYKFMTPLRHRKLSLPVIKEDPWHETLQEDERISTELATPTEEESRPVHISLSTERRKIKRRDSGVMLSTLSSHLISDDLQVFSLTELLRSSDGRNRLDGLPYGSGRRSSLDQHFVPDLAHFRVPEADSDIASTSSGGDRYKLNRFTRSSSPETFVVPNDSDTTKDFQSKLTPWNPKSQNRSSRNGDSSQNAYHLIGDRNLDERGLIGSGQTHSDTGESPAQVTTNQYYDEGTVSSDPSLQGHVNVGQRNESKDSIIDMESTTGDGSSRNPQPNPHDNPEHDQHLVVDDADKNYPKKPEQHPRAKLRRRDIPRSFHIRGRRLRRSKSKDAERRLKKSEKKAGELQQDSLTSRAAELDEEALIHTGDSLCHKPHLMTEQAADKHKNRRRKEKKRGVWRARRVIKDDNVPLAIPRKHKYLAAIYSKKSLLNFRQLAALVGITVVTWFPFLIGVAVFRGGDANRLFASPVHALLHIIAWTRPFFFGAAHLMWKILKDYY